MNVLIYVLASAAALCTGVIVSSRFEIRYYSDRLLIVALVFLVQIILSTLFLGVIVQRLYPPELFVLNVSLSTAICIVCWKRASPGSHKNFIANVSGFFSEIRASLFALVLLLLVLVQIIWTLFLGFLFPPYAWDALTYHLSSVAYWLQQGKIFIIDTPNLRSNVYPMNVELFYLWNVIFLKNDIIVDLSQLFFALLGLLTVYSISRKVGLNTRNSFVAAALYFFTPLILIQSKTCMTDVAVAVMFLIAINFAFQYSKDFKTRNLFFCGIASGILFGSKLTGTIFVFSLCIWILISWVIPHAKNLHQTSSMFKKDNPPIRSKPIMNILCFLTPIVILGCYWYLRNWVHFGSPFYPFGLRILGGGPRQLGSGIGALWANLRLLPPRWFELIHDYYNYDRQGYGPQWIILGIPGTAFLMVTSIRQKLKDNIRLILFFVLTFLFFIFLWRPDPWSARLALFLPAIGAISSGYALANFSRRGRKLVKYLVFSVIFWSALNSSLHAYFTPSRFHRFLNLAPEKRTTANLGQFLSPAYLFVDKYAAPEDRIGYTVHGDAFIYPLFGSRLRRRIYYFRKNITYEEMLAKLKEEKITYLLTNANNNVDKIAESHPRIFVRMFSGKDNVYFVKWQGK